MDERVFVVERRRGALDGLDDPVKGWREESQEGYNVWERAVKEREERDVKKIFGC